MFIAKNKAIKLGKILKTTLTPSLQPLIKVSKIGTFSFKPITITQSIKNGTIKDVK